MQPPGSPTEDDGADPGGDDLFAAPAFDPTAPWLAPRGGTEGAESPQTTPAGGAPARPDLLASLNEAQREACTHEDGPLLIVAGPGSGKTRVITHRLAHLVTSGRAAAWEVLAVTFTNKAAREMRERVAGILPDVKATWILTFHALCARILRRDVEALGERTRDFTIYDTRDRNSVLKSTLKELGFDPQRFRPAAAGSWISKRKNEAGEDGTGVRDRGAGMEDEVFARVQRRYEETLRQQNAFDFDDLLLEVLRLFERVPGVRDAYARRFRYVMVDEYQDTNRVQYLLARHLAHHHGNLAVCGDPDQSIYRWRGADLRNILDFEEDFPSTRVVRLERNYRSTATILEAASAVIANNGQRIAKELIPDGGRGDPLVVLECSDENEEAREIALQCATLRSRGRAWSEICVLYRMNFMQRALEEALRRASVPYRVVAGVEFYARREIADLVAWLRLAVNPADDVAFRRAVRSPARGVGDRSLERLGEWAGERGVSLLAAASSEEARATIRGRARAGLEEIAGILEQLVPAVDAGPEVALDLLLGSIDVGRWLAAMDDGLPTEREANVAELRAHAADYGRLHPDAGLRGFLEEVALVSDADGLDDEDGGVRLMTMHAAKGLEFPFVFVAGVEDELVPHARALEEDPDEGEEEERRLFYVALTRARERVFLTHAVVRNFFGADRWQRASRFLDEIPPGLVEGGEAAAAAAPEEEPYEPDADGCGLAIGDRVEHEHFGTGRVERLSGKGVNARAVVDFTHHGSKELLLVYAKLRPCE